MQDEHRFCIRCGRELPSNSTFCPYCGASQSPLAYTYAAPAPPRSGFEKFSDFVRGCGTVLTVLLLVLVSMNVAILIWGVSVVLPETATHTMYLFLVIPFLVDFASLTGDGFAVYYLLIVAALIVSFIIMIAKSLPILRKEAAMQKVEKHSPAYAIATLFCAVIGFNLLFNIIIALFGYNPVTPPAEPLWVSLFSLANASVYEELITRVLYIGVPLMVIALARPEGKPWWRYLVGGGFDFGRKELFFLFFSSAMFSAGHIFNWDVFKLAPTFVAGLALGYLFLKYGLWASIMLHFFVDYLSIGIDATGNSGIETFVFIVTIGAFIIGLAYMVHYALKGFSALTGKDLSLEKPIPAGSAPAPGMQQPMPPYVPPLPVQMQPTPGGFDVFCHNCGSREARYENGQLICAHCGRQL
jgi:hypothetical protein